MTGLPEGRVLSLVLMLAAATAMAQQSSGLGQPPPGDKTGIVLASTSPIVVVAPFGLETKMESFDESRDEALLPKIGASAYSMSSAAISALPQGEDTPFDKVILQAPGVSYDGFTGHGFHVRNEYANTQTRINGILLPEGVTSLGPMLETSFIGGLNILEGALPAQYGLRTAGVLDITTKSEFAPGGSANLYGGSFNTLSPSVEYGRSGGNTQYFVTGRYLRSDEGLENATSAAEPIHDKTEQGKSFGYVSTLLDDSNRLTFMTGASVSQFQIPDMPGQTPLGDFGPSSYDSTALNENERDAYSFGILALQTKGDDFDAQLSVFSRYADIHFVPDVFGDLVFNDVASDVSRKSLLDGVQFDGSRSVNGAHTLRAGFDAAAERTSIANTSTVLPTDGNGNVVPGAPITISDANSKLGWNLGAYVQDEWKLTDKLTLNAGVRFDQLYQYADANQVSPRVALVDKPFDGTTLHAGYARYFTPPMQSEAASSDIAAFNKTTQQAAVPLADSVRPERAHYFDAGIDQTILPGFTAGADGFYKIATDQLDDGQFGSAVVITQFNLAKGYSEGIVANVKYRGADWTAYANFAAVQVMVVDVVSNQYLIGDPQEFAYDSTHYHHSDDDQTFTASYGASYRWGRTLASADSTFGSGLRSGFANIGHTTPYDVVNAALSRGFDPWSNGELLTARIEIVNLFDSTYLLRSGTGIGEFAPEYGPRRGIYGSLSQRF